MYRPRDHARGRARGPVNQTTLRLREIERIICLRYQGILPDSNEAVVFLVQAAKLLRHNLAKKGRQPTGQHILDHLHIWAYRWAHFTPSERLENAVDAAMRRPGLEKAAHLGRILKLKDVERTFLKITQARACDVSEEQRRAIKGKHKRERDKNRQAQLRRKAGLKLRADYLAACKTQTRPWEKLGVSRRTWERRRKTSNV